MSDDKATCPKCGLGLVNVKVPRVMCPNPNREEDWDNGGKACLFCGPVETSSKKDTP